MSKYYYHTYQYDILQLDTRPLPRPLAATTAVFFIWITFDEVIPDDEVIAVADVLVDHLQPFLLCVNDRNKITFK